MESARDEAIAANTQRSAMLTDVLSKGVAHLHSDQSRVGSTSSSFNELGSSLNQLNQISRQVAERTGLTQAQVAEIAFGLPLKLASAGKRYAAGLSADEQKVHQALSSEQVNEFKRFGDRVSKEEGFLATIATDQREGREMSSRLATLTSRSERAGASYAERSTMADRLSAARERGETIAIDIAQDPHNRDTFLRYAREYGPNSAAAFAMMESELARRGLGPNRVFSDGTAAPSSFGDIREHYRTSTTDGRVNPDVTAISKENAGRVAATELGGDGHKGAVPATVSVREEVTGQASTLRAQVEKGEAAFDKKSGVVVTDDGTLASDRSLVKDVGKQVAKDEPPLPGQVGDRIQRYVRDATDLAKDAYERVKPRR